MGRRAASLAAVVLAGLALLLSASCAERSSEAVLEAFVEWASQEAIPIGSSLYGAEGPSLGPLEGLLAGVRVLALGEEETGDPRALELRVDLTRAVLASSKRSTLAILAPSTKVLQADIHLRDGGGTVEEALELLGTGWSDDPMVGLVRWMRRLNQSGAHETEIRGLLPDASTAPAVTGSRGAAMARSLLDQLDRRGAGARIVVWAPNEELARTGSSDTMGPYLAPALGEQLYAALLTSRAGREATLEGGAARAVEQVLQRVGGGSRWLDLRRAPTEGPVREWLSGEGGIGFVRGEPTDRDGDATALPSGLAARFDGIVAVATN